MICRWVTPSRSSSATSSRGAGMASGFRLAAVFFRRTGAFGFTGSGSVAGVRNWRSTLIAAVRPVGRTGRARRSRRVKPPQMPSGASVSTAS